MTSQPEPSTADRLTPVVRDEPDIELAMRAVRVHCPVMQYPAITRCLNCGWDFPCVTHRWGRRMLLAAGWSEREIDALDSRQGVWS